MFTGIVTDIGTITSVDNENETRFKIATSYDIMSIGVGVSICCSGVCLTVVEKGLDWFAVEVSEETFLKTTLREWQVGSYINLERSLKMGDEMGGHIVLGHIDGVSQLADTQPVGESVRMTFEAPEGLKSFIAQKGSVTVDGVSLTVNQVKGSHFTINVIPHTLQTTTMNKLQTGDAVNLEIDVLARYVSRLLEAKGQGSVKK